MKLEIFGEIFPLFFHIDDEFFAAGVLIGKGSSIILDALVDERNDVLWIVVLALDTIG